MNYYNDNDPKVCAWLRELIAAGLIPAGDVDDRSILDIKPGDVAGYIQCHFFAGIGGWPLALRMAGWPEDRPVWDGSCPCQPFSVAGKGKGEADERHLWPVFRELIRACKPPVVFGEQVASKAGRTWLSGVFADLEAMAYSRAGADLCAAGVGAPHIRQRLFWVADAECTNRGATIRPGCRDEASGAGAHDESGRCGDSCGLGDPESGGLREFGDEARSGSGRYAVGASWSGYKVIDCRDRKARRVSSEPALFPLVDGLPYKVARRGSIRPALLKGAGNAIVPQVAAEFIKAFMEVA